MMKSIKIALTIFALFTFTLSQAQTKKKTGKKPVKTTVKSTKSKTSIKTMPAAEEIVPAETKVKITTDLGDIVIKLYNKTPQHRDNFIKLVNDHFYDSLLFHRVISSFMIQGGDPKSKTAQPGEMLGSGDVGYTIPAEFDPSLYHKKGALCAARTNNPEKASSGCQFYIVQGKPSSDAELDNFDMQRPVKYTSAQRMTYKINGGTPFLDMNYTVFGEVVSGIEVVDLIAATPKAPGDRPVTDIHMKMEVIK